MAISKFSALVEHGSAVAQALPEIRSDLVEQARAALQSGAFPESTDLAAAMINSAVEGLV